MNKPNAASAAVHDATAYKLLVPAKEAAAMLSLGRSTFWQAVKDGHLPKPLKIGSTTRWRVADLIQATRREPAKKDAAQDEQH